jgi:hypothetical protein
MKNKREHFYLRGIAFATCILAVLGFGETLPNAPAIHPPMSMQQFASLEGIDSAWSNDEKQSYGALLSGAHYDWFLAPVQVRENGFARADRSMMNAELARALEGRNRPLPDSYLIERVLGDGQRQIPLHEIDVLSSRVGATTILVPTVEHDHAGNIKLKVDIYRKMSGSASIESTPPAQKISLSRNYADALAPIDAFDNLLPDLIAALGVEPMSQSGSSSAGKILALPATPQDLATAEIGNTVANAARLCVIGELAPPGTRDSERLFERCLLMARQSPDDTRQRFLLAFALLKLNHRIAAVQILKGQREPSLIALRAVVDGNLTDTAKLANTATGYERLLFEFELHDLSLIYGHLGDLELPLPAALVGLSNRSEAWAILLRLRWHNMKRAVQDNIPLKQLLDEAYPIDGQLLSDLLASRRATPGAVISSLDLQLTVHQHVRDLMIDKGATWCFPHSQGFPASWDYVSLIEAWSDINLFRTVDYQLSFLGLPEQAQALLITLDPIYNGQPDFEILQAETQNALAAKVSQPQKVSFSSDARRHAHMAFLAAGGPTDDAIEALSILGPGDPAVMEVARIYTEDYPLNPNWLNNDFAVDQSMRHSLERIALDNTQTGIGFASRLLQDSGESGKKEVRAALVGRFNGHPALDEVLEQLGSFSPEVEAAIERMRKRIAESPDVFETRGNLAYTLVIQGRYAEAAKVVASYPDFHKSNGNGVELSNYANEAARGLYWHGAEQQARELYRIATKYHVGSEAEMIAGLHLQLLDSNFEGALAVAADWVARYPNGDSYFNYMSLLHLLGRSEESWRIFNLLLDQPTNIGPWESAMVGLRIMGTDQNQLLRWVAQPKIARAGSPAASWSAHFLLMWSGTDRVAPSDLPERIFALSHDRLGTIESNDGRVASYPSDDTPNRYLIVRSIFRAERRVPLAFGTEVEPNEVLSARALVPLQHGDFANAVSRFDEVAARFPIETPLDGATSVLADFAFASAKGGDPLYLERFLVGLPKKTRFFELSLSKAYFDGIVHKNYHAALRDLDQAFGFMDHYLCAAPSTEYRFAEAAERLYRETGDLRFRDKAAQWARNFQLLQPWAAWAYVIEAELTADIAARREALVKALFLDPLSQRLKAIPDAELAIAKKALHERGNPFARRAESVNRMIPDRSPITSLEVSRAIDSP